MGEIEQLLKDIYCIYTYEIIIKFLRKKREKEILAVMLMPGQIIKFNDENFFRRLDANGMHM